MHKYEKEPKLPKIAVLKLVFAQNCIAVIPFLPFPSHQCRTGSRSVQRTIQPTIWL
jgi:hypothetical protein